MLSIKKTAIVTIVVLLLSFVGGGLFAPIGTTTAYAASNGAKKHCKKTPDKSLVAACEFGYDAAADGKDYRKECKDKFKNTKSKKYSACVGAGLEQRKAAKKKASTPPGPSPADPAADPKAACNNDQCDLIKKYVNPTINLFSLLFGLIAAISLILGGIQYASSAGDPQKVSEAKKRISNTLIAIVAYLFLFGFLQFLVPGGVFR